MTFFILSAAVLVIIALLFVVPVLLKKNYPISDQYDDHNVAIAKDRLRELKAQRDAGEISAEVYQQLHNELESTLAIDLSNQAMNEAPLAESSLTSSRTKISALLIGLFIPAFAIWVYAELGDFNAATGSAIQSVQIPAGDDGRPQMTIEEAINKLEQRLEVEPENPDGWFMLAKTYMSTQQYEKSADAYKKVIDLVGEEVQLLLGYADALAMSEGGSLTGKARPIVDKVLQMAPEVPTVLWMAGTAESQRGNFKEALAYWYKLSPMLQDEPQAQNQLNKLIHEAENKLGDDLVAQLKADAAETSAQSVTQPDAVASAEITVSVELDETLMDKVNPEGTLFIFAKAIEGPPMPLAAVKLSVSDLPITVVLDDSMAMMPQMKMSNFENVKVSAVISKSGQPGAKPGDFYAEMFPVSVNTQAKITLLINKIK